MPVSAINAYLMYVLTVANSGFQNEISDKSITLLWLSEMYLYTERQHQKQVKHVT
jgi:hypothetical protein